MAMYAPISDPVNTMTNRATKDIDPLCEVRDCQARPTRKISVKVKEGMIILQVCRGCSSKFMLNRNIPSNLISAESRVQWNTKEEENKRLSKVKFGSAFVDSVEKKKMQLRNGFAVSGKLTETMAKKQRYLQGSRIGTQQSQAAIVTVPAATGGADTNG